MQDFRYERPETVEAAVRLLAGGEARALAGGTDLVPQLRERRRQARIVVDIKHIEPLRSLVRTTSGGWRIGAAASIARLARDADFAHEHQALLESGRLIGSLQIQSRATLGGNLCNAAPSADAVPLLIALGAQAEIAGPGGLRHLPAAQVAAGPGRSVLAPDELLVALELPPRRARTAARYLRFTPRREMDIAVAGSGVVLGLGEDGRIAQASVVLASVAPTPLAAPAAVRCLVGERPSAAAFAAAGAAAAGEATPISDTRGSADYRRQLVAVLTRRALADCARQLGVSVA